MVRQRLQPLALGLLLVTAGCATGAGSGGLVVTPAPVPTDTPTPTGPPVVEVVNGQAQPYGISVAVAAGDVDRIEVAWTNGSTTATRLDAPGTTVIRPPPAGAGIRTVGLPDRAEPSYTYGSAAPGEATRLPLPAGPEGTAVLVEIRPTDGGVSYLGNREPLLLVVVVHCGPTGRVDSFRVSLGSNVTVDPSVACVSAG